MAILTINSGSSSLKLGVYGDDGVDALLAASIDSIGSGSSTIKLTGRNGEVLSQTSADFASLHVAFDGTMRLLRQRVQNPFTAIGHRMVHGGPHLTTHQRLTRRVQQVLRDSVHFAPLHIPPALDLVQHVEGEFPGVPQFACFDTAFHQTMPSEAYTYAIPKAYRDAGVRRYGFHGLSYESIVSALGATVPSRMVAAHLGGGSSVCALQQGVSVDTSMGVSPTGGVVMSTRTGDLDPGVGLLLQRPLADHLPVPSTQELEVTFNKESGVTALAGEGDMRKLLERAAKNDADAALAIMIFCREVAKTIAGYATVLGGMELLIFTGGIGEHSAAIRQNICDRLGVFGLVTDEAAKAPGMISIETSAVSVHVMAADENAMIARHVAALEN